MLDKTFQIALAISALIHSAIFITIAPQLAKRPENIRIKYRKNPPQIPQERQMVKRELIELKDRHHDAQKMINEARPDRSEFIRRQPLSPSQGSEYMPKPLSMKESFPALKKKVTLPQMELSVKINNPSYNNYYELIREKIRHAAYQNYTQMETGEIYIAFVIGVDGNLKDVRYIEDKSTPSYYLKDLAMRSIKEAAPFPAFPNNLDYPQLSFNVIISFQIDN